MPTCNGQIHTFSKQFLNQSVHNSNSQSCLLGSNMHTSLKTILTKEDFVVKLHGEKTHNSKRHDVQFMLSSLSSLVASSDQINVTNPFFPSFAQCSGHPMHGRQYLDLYFHQQCCSLRQQWFISATYYTRAEQLKLKQQNDSMMR